MKKVVILIIAVVLAFLLGRYVGNDQPSESQRSNPEKIYVDRIKEKIIRDTLRIEKPVYIDQRAAKATSISNAQDSVSVSDTSIKNDTTTLDPAIVEEKLLARRTVILKWNPDDSSSVSELLNKNAQSFNREMIVEFWSNPLNLTGYELNRNKLKLFGFHPDETIRLEIKDDDRTLFLHSESLHLRLEKTEQFKSLQL